MKKALLFVVLIFSVSASAFALQHKNTSSVYEHMLEINKNWQKGHAQNYNQLISFESDIDRIQMHLLFVEQALLAKSTKHLSEKQKLNRVDMLGVLHSYALNKLFPINTGHSVRQPYFIDNFGTHCAVGFLVKKSGFGDISKAIAEKQNFAYVREIVSPDLAQWSKVFGFTLEELAWIQPGYAPSQTYSQVGGGTNGNVTCSKSFGNRLIVGGDFTELDSLPCLNVGYYSNNQLSCYGNGIAGKVIGISELGANGVIVAGEFESNGVIYPLAKYDGNAWTYIEIPNVPNARATSFTSLLAGPIFAPQIVVSVNAPSIPNGQEVWFLQGGWQKVAYVPGVIYDIGFSNSFVLAGAFDSIEVQNSSSIPYWIPAKNFVIENFGTWSSSTDWVPDTIFSVLTQGNTIYFGGSAGVSPNGTALMRYVNGVSQPLITNTNYPYSDPKTVRDIAMGPNSTLLIGGDLNISTDWAIYGRGIFTYDFSNSILTPVAYLDSTVNTIAFFNDKYYFGGVFTKNHYSTIQDKNHLILLNGYLGITEENLVVEFSLSPNPSKGNLSIKGTNINKVEILDPMGKIIHTGNKTEMDLHHLPAGIYLVRITDQTGNAGTKRWIKE